MTQRLMAESAVARNGSRYMNGAPAEVGADGVSMEKPSFYLQNPSF